MEENDVWGSDNQISVVIKSPATVWRRGVPGDRMVVVRGEGEARQVHF